ncbi:MAG: glutamate--tRNA ligase [Ignavibacteriae bacterium HGW-Ignavibacteriae-2]|nr:MAG: glutamate--tRNA ligase [Ignavibacteriae bacterium HGW-Ignavibacteriae-2]
MINETPRVRFAPSPTGYLHVGGLRTALYNYLFAKHNNGTFILRIEDTDRNRFVEGALENLLDTMEWVGLVPDEGPRQGGISGPYIQSERLDIYKKYADELIESGKAYYCFCSSERLEELRDTQLKAKVAQVKYDKHCLNLSKQEISDRLKNGESHVIRLNVEPGSKVKIKDIVRGNVEFDRSTIDYQVLIKSDGYPTYHMANVVDDHLMKITHVIRGEEWLPSTPKHVLLYEFLNWEIPEFAHLPLLLNADKSKLSKRQGDVAVEDYREKGYLKSSLLNFVAMLGWSAGDDKEFYTLKELIENFSLERVQKSGAVFNIDKLNWLNAEHIKNQTNEELLPFLKKELEKSEFRDKTFSDEYLLKVAGAMKSRLNFYGDFIERSSYFFEEPKTYSQDIVDKRWKPETPEHLNKLISEFEKLENPVHDQYEISLKKVAEELNIGGGKLIHPVRLAVSGIGVGPGLYEILEILGKEEVIKRIKTAIDKIKLD